MNDRLFKIISKKLRNDLSEGEIKVSYDAIWFVDMKNQYWFFWYRQGIIFYREVFFDRSLELFSLDYTEKSIFLKKFISEIIGFEISECLSWDEKIQKDLTQLWCKTDN